MMKFPSAYVVKRTLLVSLVAAAISISVSTGFRWMVGAKADLITIVVRFLLPFVIAIPLGGFLFSRMESLDKSYRALLKKAHELGKRANTDPLTGLLNRTSFIEQFELATAHQIKGYFLLIDVDFLKAINDQHGHPIGDEAIIATAKALEAALGDASLIARIGGDEFCAFVTPAEKASPNDMAQAINAHAEAEFAKAVPDSDVRLSVSCGVIRCKTNQTFRDALGNADALLYQKKNQRVASVA
nr:GGDEF domain-containing protein [Kaistia granuli]